MRYAVYTAIMSICFALAFHCCISLRQDNITYNKVHYIAVISI
jgi:hypothetical protein